VNKSNIAVGLDVGTTKVCVVVARKNADNSKTDIIGVGTSPTRGLRRGVVIDVEETVTSISAALEKAERMSGSRIDHVVVSIGGSHLESVDNKGAVAIASKEGEITLEDEERTIEAASAISLSPNREVLHVIPQAFTVDDQEGIKDPIGMTGIRLEVDTHIIHGSVPFIRNLNKCVDQAGMQVDGIVAVPVAASMSVLSKRQKELGCAVIDMGGETTSIAVFEEGNMIGSKVLPVGANHITKDITVGLRTSPDIAERVKLEYGVASRKGVSKKEEIDLSNFSKLEKSKVKKEEVAYFIEERLAEIFSLVRKELNRIKKGSFLPGGIILTGGGAKMPDIIDFAKKELKLPVQIGFPREIQGIVDRVDDPAYAVPLGLVEWAFEQGESGSSLFGSIRNVQVGKALGKAKSWFKNFLP
jgi:cell division protein FtsA